MTKKCRRCGAEFITRSRIRKRCDTCQTVVSAEKQKKANERLKATIDQSSGMGGDSDPLGAETKIIEEVVGHEG